MFFLTLMSLSFKPIWFDSMGAKSSCTLVETPDLNILIDPGIAVMQPSFPASQEQKQIWKNEGKKAIQKAAEKADIIVLSHYHYDHFLVDKPDLYKGKTVFTKNPNEYINDSQRKRAENFFKKVTENNFLPKEKNLEIKNKEYPFPLDNLPLAKNKAFGEYQERRDELMEKGKDWFRKKVNNWKKRDFIPETRQENLKILYPEGKKFVFGDTTLRFTSHSFHGIEFSKVGWVFSTIVEYQGEKLIHSSDLNGPIIEDQAQMIIEENPDFLILDGPMTYMYGYLLNKTNLNRAIENGCNIVKKTDAETIIYDHHLTREKEFRKKTHKVWKSAEQNNKNLVTAAEFLGEKTVVENI